MIFCLIIEHPTGCLQSKNFKFGALQSHFPHGIRNLINWYWRVATAGRPCITSHNSDCRCGVLRLDVSLPCCLRMELAASPSTSGKNEFMLAKASFLNSHVRQWVSGRSCDHMRSVCLTQTQQIHGWLAALLRAGYVLHLQEGKRWVTPVNNRPSFYFIVLRRTSS